MASLKDKSGFPGSRAETQLLANLEALMKLELFPINVHVPAELPRHDFSYRPLEAAKGSVRLFCLLPGKRNDSIKGSLVHVTLKTKQAFEALSYAWGQPVKTHSITIAGGELPITRSLYTALIYLRLQTRIRILWIDAICIDQSNNSEKVQQIMEMRQLYHAASRVLAWMGEDDGDGSAALDLIQKIGRTDFSSLPIKQVSVEWMKAKGLPDQGHPSWHALLTFWRRSWFRRTWVVQEFMKAKEVQMICGSQKVPWKNLMSGTEMMTEYGLIEWGTFAQQYEEDVKTESSAGAMAFRLMLDLKKGSHIGSAVANSVRSFSQRDETGLQELEEGNWGRTSIPFIPQLIGSLRQTPEITEGITDYLEKTIDTSLGGSQTELRLSIFHLLTVLQYSEATDPRDKLFGILGLSKECDDEAYRPDYNESVEAALLRYARALVRDGFGIDMMYNAGISNRNIQIPSWVPDWTHRELSSSRTLSMGGMTSFSYAASSDMTLKVRLGQAEDELFISGSFLGTISKTAQLECFTRPNLTNEDFIALFISFFVEADEMVLKRESYVTGEPLCEVQWRTMIGNLAARPHIAPDELGTQYRAGRQLLYEVKPQDALEIVMSLVSHNQFFSRLIAINMTNKLCETESGLLGMVPVDTRVGDVLYLPIGSKMPYALRHTSGGGDQYQIVGASYVHGMMKGEAPLSNKWKEEEICVC